MKEIQYEIVKEIAVLSASDSGYTKEINLISWNGREPKYDIRSFSPNREKCGKGITLNADEAAALLEALQKEVNSGVSKQLVALRSSASDNRLLRLYQNGSKSPENQGFPGFCYI